MSLSIQRNQLAIQRDQPATAGGFFCGVAASLTMAGALIPPAQKAMRLLGRVPVQGALGAGAISGVLSVAAGTLTGRVFAYFMGENSCSRAMAPLISTVVTAAVASASGAGIIYSVGSMVGTTALLVQALLKANNLVTPAKHDTFFTSLSLSTIANWTASCALTAAQIVDPIRLPSAAFIMLPAAAIPTLGLVVKTCCGWRFPRA
jgi:hypothetical protein